MSTLNVNIPASLHRRAQSLAQEKGVPLDQFIATALAEKVVVLNADSYIREHAALVKSLTACFPRFQTLNRRSMTVFSPHHAASSEAGIVGRQARGN